MANDDGATSRVVRMTPAPSAHHLAESVKAGHHGASDAVENQPPANATMLSQTEQTLIARAREHFATLRQEAAASLNAIQAEIVSRRELFTQQRFEGRVRGVDDAAGVAGQVTHHEIALRHPDLDRHGCPDVL